MLLILTLVAVGLVIVVHWRATPPTRRLAS